MGLLSDSRGKMDFLDFGNVTLFEAATSTAFFVAVAAVFSDFNVEIPIGGGEIITLEKVLQTIELPFLGEAVLTLGLSVAFGLLGWQIIDASINHGRSNEPRPKAWLDSIPTGLTLATVFTLVAHLAVLFSYQPVLDVIQGGLMVEFAVVAISTAVYWAVSSQG